MVPNILEYPVYEVWVLESTGCPPVFLCMSFYTTNLQIVCSQDVKDDGEPLLNHQLVLYSPPQFLQPFHEKQKRLVFGGREWVIEQDWESVGVAAVVWEPVSASLPSLLLSPSSSSFPSPFLPSPLHLHLPLPLSF